MYRVLGVGVGVNTHYYLTQITQKNWVFEFQNDLEMKKNTNFELKKNFRKIQKFR